VVLVNLCPSSGIVALREGDIRQSVRMRRCPRFDCGLAMNAQTAMTVHLLLGAD
jgi:hypothetical protein